MENIAITCGFLLLTIVSFSQSSLIYNKRDVVEVQADNESCPECHTKMEIPISFGNEINKYELYSDYVHNLLDKDTIDQRDDIYLLTNGRCVFHRDNNILLISLKKFRYLKRSNVPTTISRGETQASSLYS